MPYLVHHIEDTHIEKHSVAICGSQGWVAATTGWVEVTCPECIESRPTKRAPDLVVRCPICEKPLKGGLECPEHFPL